MSIIRAFLISLVALALVPVTSALAHPQGHRDTRLVVLNRAGENWDDREEATEEINQHAAIYFRLAAEGQIVVGGNLRGESPLGISIFAKDVDREEIRAILESDPAVQRGIIALDFREWDIQLGEFPQEEKDKK
ncbi:MAG: hypothetical protein AAFX04_03415 [Pseudomonadota bacterium]